MTRLVATWPINGQSVSFYEPPHHEPDLLWVDGQQLAAAFLDPDAARILFQMTQRHPERSGAQRVRSGDRLVTIMCHPMAQGMCMAIDEVNGHPEDGPAFDAYCRAAAKVHQKHWRLPLDGLFAAFHNAGGPVLRKTESDDE